MEKQIRIGLWIIVTGLSYFLYSAVMSPIQFNKEKNKRSEKIINQLKDIRKAQIAFKEVNRYYASNFDELIPLIDTGEFTIIQRRDEELKFYNKVYREFQLKDTTFIDTLGFVSIKDSIFGSNYDLESLRVIPQSNGSEIILRAGKIKSGTLSVQVFEARAPKEDYLKNLDKDLIKNTSKDLIVGSMNSAKINGNWE
jgi:type II secretory pathway pseudopilin PulG